ncbi:restriction endonuclease [Bernardetia sp. ABR2-2B]|uniref:nSTAND3 domain-containing NTPase n=1 Tax=Bernardetia sp. ABR2-2B TaxID=3127472 RepID=UPI0030CE6500
MNDYDFSTLNDKEFESLVKDLLNAEFELELQDFKKGRDKGIDLRYSTPENDNSLVVQVKHYVKSKYANLKHGMINTELPKVKKLKPNRYIVVTSLELAAYQKDELKKALHPFVSTSQDIIARNELNDYLSKNEEIEKKYFKLWFSSINVFNSILNNAVEGRTRYLIEKIKRKLPLYVPTKKTDEANKILEKEKLLLITGQPGIGKTTLAEVLLLEKAERGYKIYQIENVRDAEDVITQNPKQKQLFYFDDFLGESYLEIVNADKTETQLTNFIDRIRHSENKYLILTTRTVILNHANKKHEKINRLSLNRKKFEIELTDYDNYHKALILYNHLYFSEISKELYNTILKERFYWDIIKHKNYTPRIVEFLSTNDEIYNLTPIQYKDFIIKNLNNPKEIWKKSFENQISDLDRFLLLTLFTLGASTEISVLRKSYENRLNFERKFNNLSVNSIAFENSIKILQNGFIISKIYDRDSDKQYFDFINPSLTDFLIPYIEQSHSTKKDIISSILYIEQFRRFNPREKVFTLDNEIQSIIFDKIASNIWTANTDSMYYTDYKVYIEQLNILYNYCESCDIDSQFLTILKNINFSNVNEKMMMVMFNAQKLEDSFIYLKDHFIEYIEPLIERVDNIENADKIKELFNIYGYNYEEYSDYAGSDYICEMIGNILYNEEEKIKDEYEATVLDFDDIYWEYEKLDSLVKKLNNEFLEYGNLSLYSDYKIYLDENYWEEVIERNKEKAAKEELAAEDKYEYYQENNDFEIDNLFD